MCNIGGDLLLDDPVGLQGGDIAQDYLKAFIMKEDTLDSEIFAAPC